jgi:hypothetical protein
VIDSFTKINPALLDVRSPQIGPHDGYPDDLKAGDTPDVLKEACGDAARDMPGNLMVDPSNWKDFARDNDKYHTWPWHYVDRFTNQSPTHECKCHALRACAEAARNKQRSIIFPDGPKAGFRYDQSALGSVWLSPLSIYAEANPGIRGGAGCQQVLNIACRRGFLPEKIQPAAYGFKHDLIGTTGEGNNNQSSGKWVPLGGFPSGWQETAAHFKPEEVVITRSFEEVVSLILHGYCVEVGRSGHAIPYAFWNVESEAMGYVDSYNVIRWDSKRTVQGCSNGAFAIKTMPIPQDWLKPGE